MISKLEIASSIDDAIKLYDKESSFLAGGTEINRLNSSVDSSKLISLKKIKDLKEIKVSGDDVVIGSMVTFQELIDSKDIPEYLKNGADNMGARTKRNMATIGGNIANMRDDSYIIPMLIGAKAQLKLVDLKLKEKDICICEYVKDYSKYKDMLIKSITVSKSRNVLNKRFSNTKESLACVTIGYGYGNDDASLGLAIKNLGIFEVNDLASKASDESAVDSYIEKLCKNLKDDFYGSADYKKYLLKVSICDMAKEAK